MLGPIASRFVEAYPAEAARILEREDRTAAAVALAGLPADAGARLLQAMTPHAGADWLALLSPEAAGALVSQLRAGSVAPLLHRLDDDTRAALLKALPARTAAALRLALRFPPGSVGALIDTDVVTVRVTTRVGEAVEIARRAPASLQKHLYVLDDTQRLTGIVDVRQCLLQDAAQTVGAIGQEEPVALRARMGLRQASLAEAWERFDALPVTDRRGVFLGVVQRKSLSHAISAQGLPAPQNDPGSLAFELAELFWGTTADVVFGGKTEVRRT